MQHTADIAINHLSVLFPSGDSTLTALHDVSLTIGAGQFVVVVGPSGCGKSTLLRAVGGLVAPAGGSITVGGLNPDEARLSRRVSFVFQQPVLLPWYTVRQNVELPLKLFGWSRSQRRTAAAEYLDLVGLGDFAGAYPHQLSGGMQQRVAIARALSFEPAVLLMDEPFGALDEITRERLNSELLHIWSSINATVLFVTHSLSEAAFLADRVLVLSAQPGRLISDTPVNLPRPRTPDMPTHPDFLRVVAHLRQYLYHSYRHERVREVNA
jgi:NitT/TauT family transport system ATP-binding protein